MMFGLFSPTRASLLAALSIVACESFYGRNPTGDGGPGGGGGGAPSLTALGPNPVPNHGARVTMTLNGASFASGLRVFFRTRTEDVEIAPADIRVIDAMHAHAEVSLGTRAASWYVSVASATGPRSAEVVFRVIGDDYPESLRGMPCPAASADQFGFAAGACTSFVAWRLTEDGATFANSDGVSYACSDSRTLTEWSEPRCWDEAASARGLVVDHTPRIGAIAQWNDLGPLVDGAPSGHVAYVAAVYLDTQEVLVEEYDLSVACGYSTRRVPIAAVENFIHVRDA